MADFKANDVCEKQRLVEDQTTSTTTITTTTRQPPTLRAQLFRYIIPCVLILLSLSLVLQKAVVCRHQQHSQHRYVRPLKYGGLVATASNDSKVALEAHIMSKCPDAKACLEQLVVPAMSQVSDLVDFTLSYIGTLDPDSDEVQCMHGPSECLGNIIQLCAAYEYPSPIIYLGFANCMTRHYSKIPDRDLIEGCALEHGIDFKKINNCISEEGKGIELLRHSVQHSRDVNVSTSCTIRLEGHVRCVRDGGKWKDCPGGSGVWDLVSEVELLYLEKNFFAEAA